jgi:TLD
LIRQYALAQLCYRATSQSFDSSKFHAGCDKKGPTITIVKANNRVFGGFTQISWTGAQGYVSDKEAYLFSVDREQQFFVKKDTAGYAIYDSTGYGPTFGGGHDLYIATNSNQNQNSYSNFGHSYALPAGTSSEQAKIHLAGAYNFQTSEIEVYYLI